MELLTFGQKTKVEALTSKDMGGEKRENPAYFAFVGAWVSDENNARIHNDKIEAEYKKLTEGLEGKEKNMALEKLYKPELRTDQTLNETFIWEGKRYQFFNHTGSLMGPLVDIAIRKHNRVLSDKNITQVNLFQRGRGSERYDLAIGLKMVDRGFKSILETYNPEKRSLSAHIIDLIEKRIKGDITSMRVGVGKKGMTRLDQDISDASAKVEAEMIGRNMLTEKGFDNIDFTKIPEGIQLHKHTYVDPVMGEIRVEADLPNTVFNFQKRSKEVFKNSPIKELTFAQVGKKMLEVGKTELDVLQGISEHVSRYIINGKKYSAEQIKEVDKRSNMKTDLRTLDKVVDVKVKPEFLKPDGTLRPKEVAIVKAKWTK